MLPYNLNSINVKIDIFKVPYLIKLSSAGAEGEAGAEAGAERNISAPQHCFRRYHASTRELF
jgi:hypothetical protein